VIVNKPPSPGFQSWGLTNGRFSLTITGVHNPDYAIQASTNLFSWSTLMTTNVPNLPLRWTDSNAFMFPNRFYRVQLLP